MPVGDNFPVVLGSNRSPSSTTGVIKQTCILCQEEQEVKHNERAMVLSALVQQYVTLFNFTFQSCL